MILSQTLTLQLKCVASHMKDKLTAYISGIRQEQQQLWRIRWESNARRAVLFRPRARWSTALGPNF
ncbi:hypothetical protein C5167_036287 [Papaver somniferum]|nr:hypothetical protein C5167_036287 [Papaver somniferum]